MVQGDSPPSWSNGMLSFFTIADVIKRAASGAAGILFIQGPAGIGKTWLLDAAADLAGRESVSVLRARGGELEHSFAFGIAAQLLAMAVSRLSTEQRAEVLSGTAGLAAEIVDPKGRVEARDVACRRPYMRG